MQNYDPIQLTRRYVFGTDNPSPDDYNLHIRLLDAGKPAPIQYDMFEYMTNGAGRYAYPSLFGAVEKFFSATTLDDGSILKDKVE